MTKQNQEVGNDSIAAQAGRDVTINNGIPPEQCQAMIHSALQAALPMYRAEMEAIADGRMSTLETKIVERLASDPDVSEHTLRDPDFHYVQTKAHHAFARSGDPEVGDILVDLISDRAKQTDRTRLTLSLNEAVDKVSLLTKNEFAELSLMYILKLTVNEGLNSYEKFLSFLSDTVLPFVDDVSDKDSSYLYLEAQNCGSIPPLINSELHQIFASSYGGLLSNGTTKENFKNNLPPDWKFIVDDSTLFIPCPHHPEKMANKRNKQSIFFPAVGKIGDAR